MNLGPIILAALNKMGGRPQTTAGVAAAVQLRYPGETESSVALKLRQLETDQYVAGLPDDLLQTTTWTITSKGRHALAAL